MQKDYEEKAKYAGAVENANVMGVSSLQRETVIEEHQRRATQSFDEHQRHQKAVSFLAAHPEFSEFIELIRTGSLSI